MSEQSEPSTWRVPPRHGLEAFEPPEEQAESPDVPSYGQDGRGRRGERRSASPPPTAADGSRNQSASVYEEYRVARSQTGEIRLPRTSALAAGGEETRAAVLGPVPAREIPQRLASGSGEDRSGALPIHQGSPPAAEFGPAPVHIGLWGGPNSGKTTFMGALKTAIEQRQRTSGEAWNITATDPPSLEFLLGVSKALLFEQRFPATTESRVKYEFVVRGDVPPPGRRWRKRPSQREQIAFKLHVHDRPGGDFGDDYLRVNPEPIQELADCEGLLYLFDPLAVEETKDSLLFFQGTLARLAAEIDRRGRFVGAKLPHYIAVCITKFDDKVLFGWAREWGLLGSHPVSGLTCVPDEDAGRFFDRLCEESTGTAEYVRDAIRSYFMADRIRYYVVAAIGYNRENNTEEYGDDTTNTLQREENGPVVIRSKVRPVNVVEPIIDLERMIRSGDQR